MLPLKDRMKLIRKELNLSQSEIAASLGCKTGKIKQIESGATVSISFADAKLLEKKYRINEKWLRFGSEKMFIDVGIDDFLSLENEFINKDNIMLSYYENINDVFNIDNNLIDTKKMIVIPNLHNIKNHEKLIALNIDNNSMENTFFKNDIAIIDLNDKDIIDSKIYIIYYENEFYIKRLFKIPKDKIILKSDNSFYPDIQLSYKDFTILGRIVYSINIKELY